MIEIIHFKGRFGKAMVAVFHGEKTGWFQFASPAAKEHMDRYSAGLEPPHYSPLPVVPTRVQLGSHVVSIIGPGNSVLFVSTRIHTEYHDAYFGSGQ